MRRRVAVPLGMLAGLLLVSCGGAEEHPPPAPQIGVGDGGGGIGTTGEDAGAGADAGATQEQPEPTCPPGGADGLELCLTFTQTTNGVVRDESANGLSGM